LNQEVGYFPVADKALAEVRNELEAGNVQNEVYYWGKYYHV
jgi:tetratricopeptide (TPR) repeat protein